MKNKVIVIGNDHSNTLGVIRSLGENNIYPYVIIVSNTKFVGVVKSKYVKKYFICKDSNIALLTLISEFNSDGEKPIIIPTSDEMSAILDLNYNKLKNNFIVSDVNNKDLFVKNATCKNDSRADRIIYIKKVFNKLKIMKLVKLIEKAFHKESTSYVLKLDSKISNEGGYFTDVGYKFIEINKDNYELISGSKNQKRIFKKIFYSGKVYALALKDENEIIGYGFLKSKGAYDKFVNIKNDNSYLFTNFYVNEKYRGHNLQSCIMLELINRYLKDKTDFKIFGIVYKWNLPSVNNFLKLGFKIEGENTVIRILKCSFNKVDI